MSEWNKRTDAEVLEAMKTDTAINRIRRIFSGEAARLEQAGMQRRPPTPMEYRRMEFEAAEKLMAEVERSQQSPQEKADE